jgi:micrococcal nuclease
VVAALAAAGCASSEPVAAKREATVARVGDGDSLELASGRRVRLVQIDAPELGAGECYARESLRDLEALAPPGRRVVLERDPELDDLDRYGRLLRYVFADGRNVNLELVRRGAATPYFNRGDEGRYADALLRAVAAARRTGRGMWSACRVSWRPDRAVETEER